MTTASAALDPTADAHELSAAIRRGELTADELHERVQERIDAINQRINAVVARWDATPSRAGQARASEGLLIGVQLAAPNGADARLLRLAGQLERARPWSRRVPPVFVAR